MSEIKLSFGATFEDLYSREGLVKLDAQFTNYLKERNVELFNKFVSARATRPAEKKDESNLLIELAPLLEDFIAELFNIREEVTKLQFAHSELGPLYNAKRLFVQRAAAKFSKPTDLPTLDGASLAKELEALIGAPLTEIAYSKAVNSWMDANDVEKQTVAAKYANWASNSEAGQHKHKDGVIFKKPKKLDFTNLVPMETILLNGVTMLRLPEHDWRHRDGFNLTDEGGSLTYALDQANYCIFCHNQGKDQCSKGMWDKTEVEGKMAAQLKNPQLP